jgi:hypothetical protein
MKKTHCSTKLGIGRDRMHNNIWLTPSSYLTKYSRISSYSICTIVHIRKPIFIYDFAPDPFQASFCIMNIIHFFYHCMIWYSRKELPHFSGPVISVRNPTVCPCVKDKSWTGPATHRKSEKERQFAEGRGGRGRAWSRIIRPQESLVLYKSFNPLCCRI